MTRGAGFSAIGYQGGTDTIVVAKGEQGLFMRLSMNIVVTERDADLAAQAADRFNYGTHFVKIAKSTSAFRTDAIAL